MKSPLEGTPPVQRGAGWALSLLLAINLFNYIDRYVLAAVEPVIRKEFFGTDNPNARSWMGLLATAFLVSYMVTAPIFGWLADRMSRWIIVGVGVIIWSLASGGSGLASVYGVLLATRIFVGIGEAAYGPSAPTIIADLYPIERRGSVLAWFYMAIPVGGALGYMLGGHVASLLSWRWAFYVCVPPGILLGLWAFAMRDPRRGAAQTNQATPRQSSLQRYLIFLGTPSYVLNTLGMSAMTFAVGGMAYWMPDYIHEFRGVPDLDRVNLIFGGMTAVAGLLATLLGGIVGDKLRSRWSGSYFLVSGIGMLVGFPVFLLVLVTPFPAAWALIFVAEFCLFFNTGPTNTILANVTHPAIRASAFALNIFVIHALGDAVSPPLIGKITDLAEGNMNVGFAAMSAAILASGLFWLWGASYLARDTQLAETRIGPREESHGAKR
jgi:MFS family permease